MDIITTQQLAMYKSELQSTEMHEETTVILGNLEDMQNFMSDVISFNGPWTEALTMAIVEASCLW